MWLSDRDMAGGLKFNVAFLDGRDRVMGMLTLTSKTRMEILAQFTAAAMIAHPQADAAEIVAGARTILEEFERRITDLPRPSMDGELKREGFELV